MNYMTRKQLLAAIGDGPDDTPVILAADPAGNGFSFLVEVTTGLDDGQARLMTMRATREDQGQAIILWPM